MQVKNMTEGSPSRLILSVALPLMVGSIFQQMYTVVDAQIVGGVVGVQALAALGATDWFNWMFTGVIQGLAQGFTIPMAQAFGAKDYDGLRRNVGNAVTLAAVSVLVIALMALLTINPVLHILKTPLEIHSTACSYAVVLCLAYPVVMAYNLMAGILRSLGDGKSPLYAMAIASLINIALDLLFVAGFHWGVLGAAVATAIAQVSSCVYCVYRLKGITFIHPARTDFKPDKAIASRLMALGLPFSAQNIMICVGGMILQRVVNAMGVMFIAGYTATNKLYGILEMAGVSYSYATSTYAGQNLGARKYDRIRKGVRASLRIGLLTSVVIAGLMLLFGRPFIDTFLTGTPEEVAQAGKYAWEYLWLMSVCLPFLYILQTYRSALQGMGNTVMPMFSGVVEFIERTVGVTLLSMLVGYWGVFWAEVLAWVCGGIVVVVSYYALFDRIREQNELKAQSDGGSI